MTTTHQEQMDCQRGRGAVGEESPNVAGWQCCCPAHEDDHPSLSLTDGNKGLVWKCHAGCDQRDVGAAIAARLGIAVSRLRPRADAAANGHQVIARTYDYLDAQGALVSQTVRYEPKDFRQRRPNGQGGWIWNLKDVPLVLYRLPEVLKAVAAGETIYIAEGEKAVERLRQEGLAATCSPLGAGKWKKVDQTPLHGATVVLVPDNDDAGQKHVAQVKKALHGHAERVTILRLPGLPDKGDVYDWFETAGNTTATFLTLAQTAQERPPLLDWRDALLRNRQEEPTANVLNVGLFLAHHPHWRLPSGQSVFWWDAVRGLAMVTQNGTDVPLATRSRWRWRNGWDGRNAWPSATSAWWSSALQRSVISNRVISYRNGSRPCRRGTRSPDWRRGCIRWRRRKPQNSRPWAKSRRRKSGNNAPIAGRCRASFPCPWSPERKIPAAYIAMWSSLKGWRTRARVSWSKPLPGKAGMSNSPGA